MVDKVILCNLMKLSKFDYASNSIYSKVFNEFLFVEGFSGNRFDWKLNVSLNQFFNFVTLGISGRFSEIILER